jgi:VWFA-related protein
MSQLLKLLLMASFAMTQEPVIRVSTKLVQVNVVVRNSHGAVADLTKNDFTIIDAGKEQKVALFSVSSTAAYTGHSAFAPLPPNIFSNQLAASPEAPTSATVVLFDSLNTAVNDQSYARQQILKFLKELEPRDRIAIYSLSGRGVRVLEDFTDDPERLIRAVANYKPRVSHELAGSAVEPSDTGNDQLDAAIDEMSGPMTDYYNVSRARTTLTSLEGIANHMAQLPGRKNLIWVSGSFPLTLGIDDPAVMMNPARFVGTFGAEMERAARAINNANVAVYPVDARGLMTLQQINPSLSAASHGNANIRSAPRPVKTTPQGHDTMLDLAARTGGHAFINTNDLKGAVRKAMEDAEVTYTLGFYPSAETLDGKFHELKVRVDRKGVDVRYRKGYYAMEEKPPTEKERAAILRDVISGPLESTALPLAARIDLIDQPRAGLYRVTIVVDPHNLKLDHRTDRWFGNVDVGFVQLDKDEHNLGAVSDNVTLNLMDDTYQRLLREGVVIGRTIEPKAGVTHIRVVVMDDASGIVGSIRMPVAVAQKLDSAKPAVTPPKPKQTSPGN